MRSERKFAVTIAIALFAATGAHAITAYSGTTTFACAAPQDLAHPVAKTCRALAPNAPIEWDGAVLPHSFERFGGNVAKVRILGGAPARRQQSDSPFVYVYANFIVRAPQADPLRTDYTAAHDTYGCRWKSRVEEGALAFGRHDWHWLHQADCRAVPAGTRLIRIEPTMPGAESVWRMRAQIAGGQGATLWMIRPQ